VPQGTQPGAEFRLRGKGMPRLRSVGMGDQIVRARVDVPNDLSERAREILREYAEEMGEAIDEKTSLTDRIKGFFRKKPRDEKAEKHATEA
jgi:molecular chaperone DnaJ